MSKPTHACDISSRHVRLDKTAVALRSMFRVQSTLRLSAGLRLRPVSAASAVARQVRGLSLTHVSTSAPIVPDPDVVKYDPESRNPNHLPVMFEDISRAVYRIRGGVRKTYCDYSAFLSEICECSIYLKKDLMQFTGSFKERGARNALLSLSKQQRQEGVVLASAGNHALAMAWHGKDLGIPVTCVMPLGAPLAKVDKCRKFGATIILKGQHIGEAKEYAKTEYKHLRYVNGYDDVEIIAGAGTMGVEILEQVPDVDVIVVPVGGAGLIAGVSLAVKALQPNVTVVGVEPDQVPSFAAALEAGRPVPKFNGPTLADGLAVPEVGHNAFAIAKKCVDESCTVSEHLIAIAMLRLIEMEKTVTEGAGAAALAALLPGGPLFGKYKGKKVVVPLCGGNVDTPVLGRVMERGLAADHRLIRFTVTVSDRPGGIASLTRCIADVGGSIKDIYHERAWLYSSVDQVNIKCVVETTGDEHCERLYQHLADKGYMFTKHA